MLLVTDRDHSGPARDAQPRLGDAGPGGAEETAVPPRSARNRARCPGLACAEDEGNPRGNTRTRGAARSLSHEVPFTAILSK